MKRDEKQKQTNLMKKSAKQTQISTVTNIQKTMNENTYRNVGIYSNYDE